jgi:glycosyltransferase involved in cell wall biosynthesis
LPRAGYFKAKTEIIFVMKVIHFNIDWGGGLIAVNQLHRGLKEAGVDGKILSNTEFLDSRVSLQSRFFKILEPLILKITNRLRIDNMHCISRSFRFRKHQDYLSADVLNFHVFYNGLFSYLALPLLSKKKICVLTLHDMWDFTGGCVYSFDCQRWKIGCGKCPYKFGNTRFLWKLKKMIYEHSKLTIVTPSLWMAEQVKQSMLGHFSIHHIPLGIDTEIFQPLDKEQARAALGIPHGKRVIMFGAYKLDDSRKGSSTLIEALRSLPESLRAGLVLLFLGSGGQNIAAATEMQILDLGFTNNDRLKAIAYSSADLFVLPTQLDNFPLVLLESISCGTPMVSFNTGGVSEIVRPGITGYLASPRDTKDFSKGMLELLEDQRLRNVMSKQCRETAINEFALHLESERYLDLYRTLLKN